MMMMGTKRYNNRETYMHSSWFHRCCLRDKKIIMRPRRMRSPCWIL